MKRTKQTQIAGHGSNNYQTEVHLGDLHVGDIHVHAEATLFPPHGEDPVGHSDYVQNFAPDRYTEKSARGMYYSLFAKDAIVTDITHFDQKAPWSDVVERRTTIRFVDREGKQFRVAVPGNEESPCAPGSRIIYVEASDEKGRALSFGILEKGIGWKCYPLVPRIMKWKYWRPKEGIAIVLLYTVLFALWYAKVHLNFYYEINPSINSTTFLWMLSFLILLGSSLPSSMREEAIRSRMQEFAYGAFAPPLDPDQSESQPSQTTGSSLAF